MAPSKGMDFAKKQLLKYGWKEGKGLGRKESGITDAIRPKLKFDTQGVGYDAAEQFTYNWWEKAFDKAASNIQVSSSEEGVQVNAVEESIDITTKKCSLKKFKENNSLEYGTFLKTSTLTNGGQMTRIAPEFSDTDKTDVNAPSFESLTDEDLFRICGGRTAHKGARHGMNLNGKLARIEEQEKLVVEKFCSKKKVYADRLMSASDDVINHNETTNRIVKKETKRKLDDEDGDNFLYGNECSVQSKKTKHKKKEKIKDEHSIYPENDSLENSTSKKKRNLKINSEHELENEKSKEERKCSDEFEKNNDMFEQKETVISEDTIENSVSKKKKKSKEKRKCNEDFMNDKFKKDDEMFEHKQTMHNEDTIGNSTLRKNKKSKKDRKSNDDFLNDEFENNIEMLEQRKTLSSVDIIENTFSRKNKKSKEKRKCSDENGMCEKEKTLISDKDTIKNGTSRKKKKLETKTEDDYIELKNKKSKEKRKCNDGLEIDNEMMEQREIVNIENTLNVKSKKKKKRKIDGISENSEM